MSLLPSHRHSTADLDVWTALERADRLRARMGPWSERERAAKAEIAAFVAAGPCYLGVSWGKDSVAVAWLVYQVVPHVPWVWVERTGYSNPDCPAVRDAMLRRCSGVQYAEIAVSSLAPLPDGSTPVREGASETAEQNLVAGFREASRCFGGRYLSGVRADESGTRRLGLRHRGLTTARTCSPIGWWSTPDVFAFLARHDLPVHPAYACTAGGLLDRNRACRVASIGGIRGRQFGRGEWERRYYPEMTSAHIAGQLGPTITPWHAEVLGEASTT